MFGKRRIQAKCPHDWHMVYSGYDTFFFSDRADIYCPLCDKYKRKMDYNKARSLIEKQMIARKFHGEA